MSLFRRCFAAAIASLLAVVFASAQATVPIKASKAPDARCHVGAYRLDDGRVVSVMPSDAPGTLRWRLLDGRSGKLVRESGAWISTHGWTGRPDGIEVAFGNCGQSRIRFDGRRGRKIGFDIAETRFDSHGLSLRGRLVLPRGQRRQLDLRPHAGAAQADPAADVAPRRRRHRGAFARDATTLERARRRRPPDRGRGIPAGRPRHLRIRNRCLQRAAAHAHGRGLSADAMDWVKHGRLGEVAYGRAVRLPVSR